MNDREFNLLAAMTIATGASFGCYMLGVGGAKSFGIGTVLSGLLALCILCSVSLRVSAFIQERVSSVTTAFVGVRIGRIVGWLATISLAVCICYMAFELARYLDADQGLQALIVTPTFVFAAVTFFRSMPFAEGAVSKLSADRKKPRHIKSFGREATDDPYSHPEEVFWLFKD